MASENYRLIPMTGVMAQSETCKHFVTDHLAGAALASRYPVFRARILSNAMTLRLISTLCTAALIALLVACGGDPKSQAPPIAVAFDPNFPPPASLNTGANAGIAAVVTNDNQN